MSKRSVAELNKQTSKIILEGSRKVSSDEINPMGILVGETYSSMREKIDNSGYKKANEDANYNHELYGEVDPTSFCLIAAEEVSAKDLVVLEEYIENTALVSNKADKTRVKEVVTEQKKKKGLEVKEKVSNLKDLKEKVQGMDKVEPSTTLKK